MIIMRLVILVPLITSVNAIKVSRLSRTVFILPQVGFFSQLCFDIKHFFVFVDALGSFLINGHAGGTSYSRGGLAMVGEQGPELVDLGVGNRVINNNKVDRYSIPVFFGPSDDALIEVLPTCHGPDRPPRYAPITYRELRAWYYSA